LLRHGQVSVFSSRLLAKGNVFKFWVTSNGTSRIVVIIISVIVIVPVDPQIVTNNIIMIIIIGVVVVVVVVVVFIASVIVFIVGKKTRLLCPPRDERGNVFPPSLDTRWRTPSNVDLTSNPRRLDHLNKTPFSSLTS
jgi:hypothetical protein